MDISISLATSPSAMPQIMFAGDIERHCADLAALGYGGLDLFFPQPRAVDVKAIKRLLDTHKLCVSMLASQADLMADGLFLNIPACLSSLLERSRYHLEQCAILHTKPNIGFLRGRHSHDIHESCKHMAEGIAAYCQLASCMGVDVLMEPICRYEINSLNTTAQAMDMYTQAGSPSNLYLLLDIFHMNIEEASIGDAIRLAGARIGHVHFVDNTRAVPGLGCLPLAEIVETFTEVGYNAFLGIEAIPGADPLQEAAQALIHTRQLLSRTVYK